MEEFTIAGNTWREMLAFAAVIFGGWLIGKVSSTALRNLGQRLASSGREMAGQALLSVASVTGLLSLAIAYAVGLYFLKLGTAAELFKTSSALLLTAAVTFTIYRLVEIPVSLLQGFARKSRSRLDDMMVPLVGKTLRLLVVLLGVVQVAQILSGQSISSILAGLGLGGLAFALAAQDTLKNFFGSVVIFTDKPFELGDRIVFDCHDGIVEDVGFRSTKIRRLDGQMAVVPNSELANRTIHNISRRPNIRRWFSLTITYDTPPEKVIEGKRILEEILADHEGMQPSDPPRVYFSDFHDAALGYTVAYWYHPTDYWAYMAFSEKVNLEILRRFNAAGIDFAFPTQTLFLAGDPKRPLLPPPTGSAPA